MNEEKMERFVDGLLAKGPRAKRDLNEEERALESLWDELGSIESEPERNEELVSEFQYKLEAYRQGWTAALATEGDARGETSKRFWPKRVAVWAAAAGAAAVLAFSLFYARQAMVESTAMRSELISTRETLAMTLLEQASPASRLKGIEMALEVRSPGRELRERLSRTLSDDPNLNVRLAAISMTERLDRDEAISVLMEQLRNEKSPLMQLEILRQALRLAGRDEEEQVRRAARELPLAPRIKDFLEKSQYQI